MLVVMMLTSRTPTRRSLQLDSLIPQSSHFSFRHLSFFFLPSSLLLLSLPRTGSTSIRSRIW